MINCWDCPTSIIIVFYVSCLSSLESLMDIFQHTEISHPPGSTTLVMIFILFFLLSFLVNSLLNSPGYCDQDPLIPVFPIHDFSKCMPVIFSLVTCDDVISDSSLLDILPCSIHKLLEFFLCYPFHITYNIYPQGVLCNEIHRVIFTLNILDKNTLLFHYVSQKMVTNVNVFL